jgi:hypothetical protein
MKNFSQSFWSGDASWICPTKGFTSVAQRRAVKMGQARQPLLKEVDLVYDNDFILIIDICFYANFSILFSIKALALPSTFNKTTWSLNPSL